MARRDPLDVWLYGTRIAVIADHGGRINLRWTSDASQRWGTGSRVMSQLLPIARPETSPPPRRVEVFLQNLLPEGSARTHLAFDAGVAPDDIFGMIEAYGRDTAGALVFMPEGSAAPDRKGRLDPISEAEAGAMLDAAARNAPALGAVPRLRSTSLAGMQPKIVLARASSGWARCLDGYPSTHIVKLAHPVDSAAADVVHTEVACIAIARAIGLTSITADLADFAGYLAIVVSRYDRTIDAGGTVTRIHQEDSAQALGINTADPDRKFQRGRQLPSLAKIAAVLRDGGSEPDELLRLTAFNLAVGNTDAHAKNISLLRRADGRAELAPAYDIAMHLHHEGADRTFAMDINSKTAMDRITADDLVAEAVSWPLPRPRAIQVVAETLGRTLAALDSVDTSAYPGVSDRAWDVVRTRTRGLLDSVPAAGAGQGITTGVRRTGQPRIPRGVPEGGRFASPQPQARFDTGTVEAFEELAETLLETPPDIMPDLPAYADRRTLLPFYEAYFSNFIEGTEFTLDEAADIVFARNFPEGRPHDAHDVLGTYQIVADPAEMAAVPRTADGFIDLLRARHAALMSARPEKNPGHFKTRANRAGATKLIAPGLVAGTLRAGFDVGKGLLDPFARAVYLMFVVAEVRPFDDGNGLVSRIMMNAELASAGEVRIVVPVVYRANYLAALEGARHNRNFGALARSLSFARRYTARVDFSSRPSAEADLARTHALDDAGEAEDAGVRLSLP